MWICGICFLTVPISLFQSIIHLSKSIHVSVNSVFILNTGWLADERTTMKNAAVHFIIKYFAHLLAQMRHTHKTADVKNAWRNSSSSSWLHPISLSIFHALLLSLGIHVYAYRKRLNIHSTFIISMCKRLRLDSCAQHTNRHEKRKSTSVRATFAHTRNVMSFGEMVCLYSVT